MGVNESNANLEQQESKHNTSTGSISSTVDHSNKYNFKSCKHRLQSKNIGTSTVMTQLKRLKQSRQEKPKYFVEQESDQEDNYSTNDISDLGLNKLCHSSKSNHSIHQSTFDFNLEQNSSQLLDEIEQTHEQQSLKSISSITEFHKKSIKTKSIDYVHKPREEKINFYNIRKPNLFFTQKKLYSEIKSENTNLSDVNTNIFVAKSNQIIKKVYCKTKLELYSHIHELQSELVQMHNPGSTTANDRASVSKSPGTQYLVGVRDFIVNDRHSGMIQPQTKYVYISTFGRVWSDGVQQQQNQAPNCHVFTYDSKSRELMRLGYQQTLVATKSGLHLRDYFYLVNNSFRPYSSEKHQWVDAELWKL